MEHGLAQTSTIPTFLWRLSPACIIICANPQSHFTPGRPIALAHFTAQAGKVYYFRTRAFGSQTQWLFDLDPIDSDQAKYLIASYPLSISHPKAKEDDSSGSAEP